MKKIKQKGFSLVELLVVLTISSVITMIAMNTDNKKAALEQTKKISEQTLEEIKQINKAAGGYSVENQLWPDEIHNCVGAIAKLKSQSSPSSLTYLSFLDKVSPYQTNYITSCDTLNFNIEIDTNNVSLANRLKNSLVNTSFKKGVSDTIIVSIPRPEEVPLLASFLRKGASNTVNVASHTLVDVADIILPDGRKLTDLWNIIVSFSNIKSTSVDILVKTALLEEVGDTKGVIFYDGIGDFDENTTGVILHTDTRPLNNYSFIQTSLLAATTYRVKAYIKKNNDVITYSKEYTFDTLAESVVGTQWTWTVAGTYQWIALFSEELQLTMNGASGGGSGGVNLNRDGYAGTGGETLFSLYKVNGGQGGYFRDGGGNGGGGGYKKGGDGGQPDRLGGASGGFIISGGRGDQHPSLIYKGGVPAQFLSLNINVIKGNVYTIIIGAGGSGASGGSHGRDAGVRLLKK